MSDFNFDGYNDIICFCHRRDGDFNQIGKFNEHVTDSFLYWGGPSGFGADRKLNIPGRGMHFRKTTDELGHVYNRGFLFDYVSSPYNYGSKQPLWINWKAEELHRSKVKFQVRVAQNRAGLEKADWQGAKGEGTYFAERNSSLKHLPKGSWMQYRAVLDTHNGVHAPVLDTVEIAFE